ncbi:MAG: flagellar biosynthesis anti-sigma factor FlgM [Lachnospiraceae bacterium]|nr:flagellar biosynthesis anti-sigma factor FlgM [Lachnospiraceae bacterium]
MRIEAYTQVQQTYKAAYTNKVENKQGVSKTDNLQISSVGKDITVAKQAIKDTAEIREDIIASLKEKVQNGTYDVSTDNFADKLLERLAGF